MARKASDMVMLLRSRGSGGGGRRRGRKSGLLSQLGLPQLGAGLVRLLGGANSRHDPGRQARAAAMVPGWLALAGALLCFGGGWVVRGYLTPDPADAAGLHAGAGPAQGSTGTRSPGPRAPGVIDAETEPLANQGFFVAAYEDLEPAEAKARAVALSRWLQAHELPTARPYEYPAATGPLWVVVVYYDGAEAMAETEAALHALPRDVPDPIFVGLRNAADSGWPNAFRIR